MKTGLIPLMVVVAAVAADAGEGPSPSELLPKLRQGGYVLFIRHPRTNPDQADTDPLNLDNVKAQRQLSDEGRKQAKALGEAFRALKIPVDKVVSSKFYRAQEAAKLLDVGEVAASVDVTEGGLAVPPRENERRAKAPRGLLATGPPEGKKVLSGSPKASPADAAGKWSGDGSEGAVGV